MKHELTPELLEKCKSTASAAALLALAKENGIDMTAEDAAAYYTILHPQTGKIADEELDNVAGGGCHGKNGWLVVTAGYDCDYWTCANCGQPKSAHTHSVTQMHCPNGQLTGNMVCDNCSFCSCQGGTMYCTNVNNIG